MLLRDRFQSIIREELRQKPSFDKLVDRVCDAARQGSIAFFPCSKFSRQIIKEMRARHPSGQNATLLSFDKSPQAVSEPGVQVCPFERFDEFADEISLLVIASSTYYGRQERDIIEHTRYRGPIVRASFFDYTMPPGSPDELAAAISAVCDMLADKKSQMCYLLSWLSRIVNDEDVTSLFESENPIPDLTCGTVEYKGYSIRGLDDPELKKELFSDVYNMRHVAPCAGDVVLDVGGFRGETAIVFADRVGPGGKVFAFEPVPASYRSMIDNIRNNGLEGIITPVNKGCSGVSRSARAISAAAGAPWSYICEGDGAVDVELVSIDDFARVNDLKKVDFIKVDVEGFESDVLGGAKWVLESFRPRLAIALYHKSSDLIEIPRLVRSLGDYRLYVRSNMDGPFGLNLFCA
jgi:FkbM family methyltransferase